MPASIVEALEGLARQAPHAVALSWRDVQWAYADLQGAVTQVRSRLSSEGLERGTRVALLLRNSPQYVALFYGVLAAGCVAVPLNPQERASVLARQIEHCGAKVLMGDASHPEWAALQLAALTRIAVTLQDGAGSLQKFMHELEATPGPTAGVPAHDELAMLLYTSGTTGRPKGVMLTHGNLIANASAIREYLQLTAADSVLCVLPFQFAYGNSVLNSHVICGAKLAIEDNFAFPRLTLQRLQDEGITGFPGVPTTFALLIRSSVQEFDLRRLRYVTQAGSAMPPPLAERLRKELPHTELFVMYGQSEATARLTYLPPSRLADKAGSVGIPVREVEIDIRGEQGESLPAGTVGEICARGPNLMRGYWADDAATAEVLRDGWLHTGDLGYRDEDGYIFVRGRRVEMLKIGAFRVSPQEVEEVIATFPGIAEVAVTAITDEVLGQAIKAVIVPEAGVQPDLLAVRAHCNRRLAAFKVPKIVELAASLPRTASGKVQRFKLV
jgi:long-chain acyl-CoA synthetase